MSRNETIKSSIIVCIFVAFISNVESSRILAVIPTPNYSHQMFYQPIWRELALRGHEITVITTDPTNATLKNLKEISIREAYVPMRENIKEFVKQGFVKMIITNRIVEFMNDLLYFEMTLPQVQELIHNDTEHFDLFIAEFLGNIDTGFMHKFKCPMIGVWNLDACPMCHEAMGNPSHPVLYPNSMVPLQENMSFSERAFALMFDVVFRIVTWRNTARVNKLTREVFGADTPNVNDLAASVDMLFINAHPLFSAIRPLTPSTINLDGGLHIKKAQPLPEKLRKFLDSSPHGAIYFSLGSNVQTEDLPIKMRQLFMKTLAQLPYKVVWKFENDTHPGKPDNVLITKWAPQQDVLRHPNVKLFITQGGSQSLEEALFTHVPMVVLPLMGDQASNAIKIKSKKLGLFLDPHTMREEDFKEAILEVMNNAMYRDNLKQLAVQILDQPMAPLERAIWWIEYVLRHKGAQHLKGPRIPWWQYYYLDVICVFAAVIMILLWITVWILRLTWSGIRLVMRWKSGKQKQN